MEVPAPDSGEAAATGKRGTGVGRALMSLGRERTRGCGASGDAELGLAPVGVARGEPAVGEGRGGRRRGCRCPPHPPSALPVLVPQPGCCPSSVSSFLFPAPPVKVGILRRRVAFSWKLPSGDWRRAPGVEGECGESCVALASVSVRCPAAHHPGPQNGFLFPGAHSAAGILGC